MSDSIKVRKIGKYILQRQLGQGTMGTIWLSHHMGLDLPVAVKLLKPSLLQEDPEYLERFIQEGNLAGSINHKNIIRIFDAGNQGKTYYMVMEYVDGGNALELIEDRGRLAPEEVIEFGLVICDAMRDAHEHNIIHRDIKPENIMLTSEGRIKIADLGLAKRIDDDYGSTMTGFAIGTPYYMSPEQSRNAKDADERCDIYSIGATLYHLLVGKVPFDGESSIDVILRHCNEELIPPHRFYQDIPENLSKTICKMMAKSSVDRFQSCEEIYDALNKIKYAEENKGKLIGKTPINLKSVDIEKIKATSADRRANKQQIESSKNNKALLITLVSVVLIMSTVIMLKMTNTKQKDHTVINKKIYPIKREDIQVVDTSNLNQKEVKESVKEDIEIARPENSSSGVYRLLEYLKPNDRHIPYFKFNDNRNKVRITNSLPKNGVGFFAPKRFVDYKMGFQFRWLAENSHVRICIYKNPEFKRYVDILFVENENAPQISVKYIENPKVGVGTYKLEKDFKHWKIFKPAEDFEKPFGEWNTVFVIKKDKILQLFMNQKKIGNVIIDFVKKSPIGFSFLHPCDVEFRSINVTEIKE